MKNEEIPFLSKVKIISSMTLIGIVILAVVAGAVSYQRNQKQQDAARAAQLKKVQAAQVANVQRISAVLPLFRDTKQFRIYKENTMVKVRIEDLPATITAETIYDHECRPGDGSIVWEIQKGSIGDLGEIVASSNSGSSVDGWLVTEDGKVTIPAGSSYGKYVATFTTDDQCADPETMETGMIESMFAFKIVPPCPTGGVLTHTP